LTESTLSSVRALRDRRLP